MAMAMHAGFSAKECRCDGNAPFRGLDPAVTRVAIFGNGNVPWGAITSGGVRTS